MQEPMKYNVIYTTQSRHDLDDIWDYIAFDLQNPTAAESTLDHIMDAVDQLNLFPESGAPLSSISDFAVYPDERFLVSGNYLVFYHTAHTDVFIDRVLYGGRDYLRILFRDAFPNE